jgi:class 3 adenylate cyclase
MPSLPSGTVTFVFSDIVGSTILLKQLGDAEYAALIATHRRLMREILGAYHGEEIDTQGDAFFYSFARARDAVAAAVEAQRAHARASWPREVEVRIRLGLHTGEPAIGDEGYTGLDVVRASRIAATALGGQVLLSDTTRAIVHDALPEAVTLRALGERRLRDIDRPEPITELVIPDVEVLKERAPDEPDAAPAETPGPMAPPDVPGMPAWVRDAARQFIPGTGRARDLIEERVLSAIDRAFDESSRRRSERRVEPGPSVADEVERLRGLREAGALSEEQYRAAVDRVIGSGNDD